MPLLRKTLHDLRWQIAGNGVGLGLLAALYVVLYPTFAATLPDLELPEAYSAFIGDVSDLSSSRNFLQIEFFSLWLPLLVAIYAIVASTAQLAGDEGNGTLELLLAQPVSRRRLFLERATGLLIGALVICALASLGFLVSAPFIDLRGDVTVLELMVAPLGTVAFAFAFIALGLLAGTIAATRGQAVGLLTAATVAFYLMDVLPDLTDALAPLRYLSPFYYGDTKRMLITGVVPWHQAVLFVSAALCTALAMRAFEAREIGVGRWQPRALLGRSA